MKATKVTGRGTGRRTVEVGTPNWAGDEYRRTQKERLEKVGKNLTLVLGRGDRKILLKDLPEPRPRPSTTGRTRVTNRGTGSRKSTNSGN